MSELVYDEVYEERRAQLVDLIEWIERQVEPMAACQSVAFEAGLATHDLQRILRCRDRWPHWRDERFVPPLFVQKAMLREGHYGPDRQARAIEIDA